MNAEQVVAEVFGLYEQHGAADYIGEPVSQIEHMSQAAQLAMAEGFDDEVVLAAFFHDIGHIC
ncbi:MAG: phosphohydrolase, partial [Pseudomonas sp.]|nr:phosphohydrolase [Pseudomonas sp.]